MPQTKSGAPPVPSRRTSGTAGLDHHAHHPPLIGGGGGAGGGVGREQAHQDLSGMGGQHRSPPMRLNDLEERAIDMAREIAMLTEADREAMVPF